MAEHPSHSMLFDQSREHAYALGREALTLYFAARDPRTPKVAKDVVGMVVAYVPADSPDPRLYSGPGFDDVILAPLGLMLALKLVPSNVLTATRAQADAELERHVSRTGAAMIIAIWIVCARLLGRRFGQTLGTLWCFLESATQRTPGRNQPKAPSPSS